MLFHHAQNEICQDFIYWNFADYEIIKPQNSNKNGYFREKCQASEEDVDLLSSDKKMKA